MITQNKLVAIYVRKSRLKNDDSMEISRQIELLIDFANKNNMQYKIYHEEGSSENWNRIELQKMLREVRNDKYDGVLVTEQDRISRDSTDFGLFKRICIEEGLMFYTLNKTFDFSNDDDNFMTGITAEMDNHFMRVLKRKMMRGRVQALNSGVYFGIPPYGYNKSQTKPKILIKHPEQSKVVEMIFDMYVNKKKNQEEIVRHLNLLGHKTNENKPFTNRSISIILKNVAYIGTVYYKLEGRDPIIKKDAHEPIVDKDVFDEAQIIRKERRIVPQKSKRGSYPLSGLIVCPKCKTTLSFCMKYPSKKSKEELNKKERELYVLNCHSSKSKIAKANASQRCSNMGVKSNRIEEKVFEELESYIEELEQEIEILINEGGDIFSEVDVQINDLEKRLNQLSIERKRIQEGFKVGIYDQKEASHELTKLDEDKSQLEFNLGKLKSTDSKSEIEKMEKYKDIATNILTGEMEVEELNTALREIIECIYYYKDIADNRRLHPMFLEIVYKQ
ncbi:recombinase family protein [Sporosarcina sp. FSL W7-1283]|uniref:recombinase family protein n=1 Tax=Sporosarcina sp. FSL W7-1283 TaxID=2921560 RepID=UPI0030FCB86D